MAHWLSRLLAPRSIAIVGASERSGSLGGSTRRLLVDRGYRGKIFSVNPKHSEQFGEPCYADLAALPQVPDLVVFAISGLPLEQSFEQAIALGVGGAVIYAANHLPDETEPGLVARLRNKAAAAGMPVIGGNSMGFYNYDDDVFVSFDSPPPGRPAGHIGLIVHSGSGMTYMANNDVRFCFNYVIASAQEIHATFADYMDFLLEQASTRVIALVLENVRDVPAFTAALEKARQREIPVLVTRLGRTEQAARMALSHSGAIVGDQQALAALCWRYGARLCRDMDELLVTAMLFGAGCRVSGGALASMLDSGGMREQMIDLAADHGVEFATISDTTAAVLRTHLEPHLEAVNPMDGMGDLGRNTEQTYRACGEAMLDDTASGALAFEFEFRDGFCHYPGLLEVAEGLAAHSHKPVVVVNSCAFADLADTAAELTWRGVPVINGIDLALRALAHLMAWRPQAQPAGAESDLDENLLVRWRNRLARGGILGETESLTLLRDFGFPAIEFTRADTLEAVCREGERIGYPLVIKTAAEGVAHKSDVGGVRVGITGRAELEACYTDISSRLGAPVLLMPQVAPGVEVALGLKYDSQFGPLVIVACGGVLIELLGERAFRLAPLNQAEAEAMLDETRLARLLAGFRGQPAVDRDALVALVLRFGQLVVSLGERLAEVDLNPVIVGPSGVTIVDALVVTRNNIET